jgi:hypothetical protein
MSAETDPIALVRKYFDAIENGEPGQSGGEMRARFAIFLELRDGRIVRQGNYDCFDPF